MPGPGLHHREMVIEQGLRGYIQEERRLLSKGRNFASPERKKARKEEMEKEVQRIVNFGPGSVRPPKTLESTQR